PRLEPDDAYHRVLSGNPLLPGTDRPLEVAACARWGIGDAVARDVLAVRQATGFVRGGGVNAIELTNVSKVYRRYTGRQFSTLKSALLQRSIMRDLRPSEVFQALADVSFTVPQGSTFGVIGRNGS